MSVDFFGQGFGQDMGIKFTEEEQLFFKAKLVFLDPQSKKTIQLGQVYNMLKYSGLPSATQKQILDNLKLSGKPTIDYTQMKKIFRGVALAQDKKTPSLININANIKTPLPKFYDQDSDEQQEPKQQVINKDQYKAPPIPANRQSVPAPAIAQTQAHHPAQPASSNKVDSSAQFSQFGQFAQQQTKPSSSKTAEEKESGLSKGMKKYEDFWVTLTTEDGVKISGNQVKRLFGKSQNKKQLAKIWKLCSNSYKGFLSKGQLYIFIALMKSKSGLIPSSLTPQMKQAIQKLDGQHAHKQRPRSHQKNQNLRASNNAFDFDRSQVQKSQSQQYRIEKKGSGGAPNRMSASHADFDDFANFANPSPKFQNQKQPQPKMASSQQFMPENAQISRQNQLKPVIPQVQNSQPQSPTFSSPNTQMFVGQSQPQQQPHIGINVPPMPVFPQVPTIPAQSLINIQKSLNSHFQSLTTTLLPQLEMLSQSNKQSVAILQQTNQFLSTIDQANSFFQTKFNELKVTQDDVNNRLNRTCIRMRDVILKQTQMINSMVAAMQGEADTSKERVTVLQAYCGQIQNQTNENINKINGVRSGTNASRQQQPSRSSITTIPQYQATTTVQQAHHQNQYNQQQQNMMYNKKSMQSMRQMTESMAVKKKVKKQTTQETVVVAANAGNNAAQYAQYVPPAGMYRQKLMEQLKEKLTQVNDNNTSIQESTTQIQPTEANAGYHWQIGQSHQVNANQASSMMPNAKKTQSEDEQQQKKKQLENMKRQQQLQQQSHQFQQVQQAHQVQQVQQVQQMQYPQHPQQIQQFQQQAQQLHQAQQPQQIQQPQRTPQQIQAQMIHNNNLRMKQARLIIILNQISPIRNQDHPQIVRRVSQMPEIQIDKTYAQMYNKYIMKIQHDKKQAQKKGVPPVINPMPTYEQFRTNNFQNNEPPAATGGVKF